MRATDNPGRAALNEAMSTAHIQGVRPPAGPTATLLLRMTGVFQRTGQRNELSISFMPSNPIAARSIRAIVLLGAEDSHNTAIGFISDMD